MGWKVLAQIATILKPEIVGTRTVKMALFTPDTHFVVYLDAKDQTPSQELHSREKLAPVFADLNRYAATITSLGRRRFSH